MKNNKLLFIVLALIVASGLFSSAKFFKSFNLISVAKNMAAVFFVDSITANDLKNTYNSAGLGGEKFKILIVPGHYVDSGGALYRNLKEADLNLAVATQLSEFLKSDNRLEVIMVKDGDGVNGVIENYYLNHKKEIADFVTKQKSEMSEFVGNGLLKKVSSVEHRRAPDETALRLYGVNKWASENKIGAVIHIHFNDYPRRRQGSEGDYTGFSVYIPEKQYSNAKASRAVAEKVFDQLDNFYPKSDYPKENVGLVEDQELIAVGSFNSIDSAAFLIEYAYIYESQLKNPKIRESLLKELALQTYIGLENFFGGIVNFGGAHQTFLVPYSFDKSLAKGEENSLAVLSLQTALLLDGVYPPLGKTKYDCPLTGNFRECTLASVKQFQQKYDITGGNGFVGAKTREKLNALFF